MTSRHDPLKVICYKNGNPHAILAILAFSVIWAPEGLQLKLVKFPWFFGDIGPPPLYFAKKLAKKYSKSLIISKVVTQNIKLVYS